MYITMASTKCSQSIKLNRCVECITFYSSKMSNLRKNSFSPIIHKPIGKLNQFQNFASFSFESSHRTAFPNKTKVKKKRLYKCTYMLTCLRKMNWINFFLSNEFHWNASPYVFLLEFKREFITYSCSLFFCLFFLFFFCFFFTFLYFTNSDRDY